MLFFVYEKIQVYIFVLRTFTKKDFLRNVYQKNQMLQLENSSECCELWVRCHWQQTIGNDFTTWCFFPETKRKTNNEFGHITTLSFWSWDSSTKSVVTSPSYVQFQQGFNALLHFLNLQTHSCHGEKRRESQETGSILDAKMKLQAQQIHEEFLQKDYEKLRYFNYLKMRSKWSSIKNWIGWVFVWIHYILKVCNEKDEERFYQWLFLVPVKGGR